MKPGPLYALPEPGSGAAASKTPISVVLADDHAFMRRSLRRLLDAETEFEVVAEASDIPTVLRHVRGHLPHVLVLDLSMPGGSSLTAIRRLRSEAPNTEIVVTTMTDDPRFAREAIAAGASGYVLKDDAHRDLSEAVRRAARGESFVTQRVGSALSAYGDRDRDPLSEREVDVLRLIALGHTNAEIGRLLQISVRTVETHRAHIHHKLGISTRAQLVHYALRRGLLIAPAPSPLAAIT
jgi:two-component system response regulator NreC